MADDAQAIRRLAAPLAAHLGVDVVDVVVRGEGQRRLVRVVVDRKGGLGIAQCQELARDLSDLLDDTDPIAGRFTLEVTSPGTDWPLETRDAFDRVEGRTVHVRLAASATAAPTEELEGTVVAADEDVVTLDIDGSRRRVAYDDISTATQVLPW